MAGKQLRLVEFYAGVGGWHVAVNLSELEIDVVAALDINTIANAAYKHNFPNTCLLQRNICGLSTQDLDAFNADIFTISPPCQPFTRQGKKGDSDDRRTDSFFHLMHIMSMMISPPQYLMVENVRGFEVSYTRQHLIDLLTKMGYIFQEFLLSPKQIGIPNSRLRYYLLAKRSPLQFLNSISFSNGPCQDASVVIEFMPVIAPDKAHKTIESAATDVEPVNTASISCRSLSDFLVNDLSEEELEKCLVPDKVLQKYAMGLDIVQPSSTSSCCFTRGYYHYAVGTGSVIQHAYEEDLSAAFKMYSSEHELGNDEQAIASLRTLKLRYFTPREVANLMCFPTGFSLPDQLTAKQCYRVVGNSVNALVVSTLLRYLLDHVR